MFLWTFVLLGGAWLGYQLRFGTALRAGGRPVRSVVPELTLPEVVRRGRSAPVRSLTAGGGGEALAVRLEDGTWLRLSGFDGQGRWSARALAAHPDGCVHLVDAGVEHGGSVVVTFGCGGRRIRLRGCEVDVRLAGTDGRRGEEAGA